MSLPHARLVGSAEGRGFTRISQTLNDEISHERLEVANTTDMIQAVSTAVDECLRRRRLERFRALRGEVEITSDGEIEAAETAELEPHG